MSSCMRLVTASPKNQMVVSQGDVWWAELPATGSGPGFRRPVVIVQGDALNRSRLATTVCVPLITNLRWTDAPGNLLLAARLTNLEHDSVANVSQILTVDKALLTEHVGKLSRAKVNVLLSGIDVVLGR
jgi:mRNA interferase MazF